MNRLASLRSQDLAFAASEIALYKSTRSQQQESEDSGRTLAMTGAQLMWEGVRVSFESVNDAAMIHIQPSEP